MFGKSQSGPRQQVYMSSPADLHNDSLEQMAREDSSVVAVPFNQRNYELTFKKNPNSMFFHGQSSMLSATERQILAHLRYPLAYYQKMSLDDLSLLPFADLYSLNLPERQKSKLKVVGQILEYKRLVLKARSVSLNYRCLSVLEAPTHEDKNRLFILQLLEKQLNKKYFIQALKVNHQKSKFKAQFNEQQYQNDYNPEKTSPRKINQQLFGQEQEEFEHQRPWNQSHQQFKQQEEPQHSYDEQQSQNQGQVLIMIQVISSITKKLQFWAFKAIKNLDVQRLRSIRNSADISPIVASKRQTRINTPHQVLSHQYINHQNQSEQPFPEAINQEPSQQQSMNMQQMLESSHLSGMNSQASQLNQQNSIIAKLNELDNYIEELHDEAAQNESVLKQFFIRWKIRLFQSIADNLIEQLRAEQQQQYSQVQDNLQQNRSGRLTERQQNNYQDEQQQMQGQIQNYWSRNTTQLSQADNGLKHQKSQLKQYLYQNQIKIFFKNLSYYHQNSMIKNICRKVYRAKLMKNVFQALLFNSQEEVRIRDMEQYYEQIAELQEQDDTAAYYFWKTNVLHRYFKTMKQNRRDMKMSRILNQVTIKLTFRKIKELSYQGKKSKQALQRFKVMKYSKLLFKCFSGWKQYHRLSSGHYEKLKSYKLFKNQQLKSHIFSILKLDYKRMLVKSLKAQNHFSLVTKDKTFQHLRLIYQQNQYFRSKQETLQQYIIFRRSKKFFNNFIKDYFQYIQFQRMTVKQEKLKRTLLSLHALKKIKSWRRNHMKKSIYQTIEEKLTKFHQKQKKKQIMYYWLKRTFDKGEGSSPTGSDKHKKWLVDYYSGLCSVMHN